MAARRLLIVMVVMLAALTVATALVDVERPEDDAATGTEPRTETETEPEERAGPAPGAGEELDARVDADADEPERIRARAGDDLALEVRASEPTSVEIGGLGLLRSADRDAPARFLAFLDRPGTFPVLASPLTGEGPQREIATIEVSPALEGATER